MYAEQATQLVEEENLDELIAQPEPQLIKVSTGQALYQQITGSPYFVEDAEQVTKILNKNPHFPFAVRKSSATVEGMITFTTVYDTNKGIVFTRYGINDNGELSQFDKDNAYKIKEVSSDLLSVLQEQTLVDLKRINQAKSIEDVTFHRGEKEVPQTQRLFVGERGFFALRTTTVTAYCKRANSPF